MGRKYAGILGSLAFVLIVARGLVAGRLEPGLLGPAIGAMFVMAGVGWLAGTLAESLVSDAVRARFAAALQEQQAAAESAEAKADTKGRRAA